ncbi:phosphate signaling complex protein PhoU [Anaerosinus massiliensis]|uniref:phosphate signaling complex protein PhoU n=1 Tax=Massilibacillus massiliensis TaxID=1806837 RepID=UPI000AA7186D|nr:phosphate signaling complex protein PhoU [Massilibacillus massiliensis]
MVGVTRQAYIEELEALRKEISKMGMAVDQGLRDSINALVNRDIQLAKQVMLNDDLVDEMNVKIEDSCMLLIARQQPIARDLRIIATGLKISTDLERIGDHAHDIAKTATEFDEQAFIKKLVDIPQMAEYAGKMLQDAILAYNTFDVALAEQVCLDDDRVDMLYAKTFRELSKFVVDDPIKVKQATQLIFIARYLERVADHATNIAEWVIYLVTAERIRKNR